MRKYKTMLTVFLVCLLFVSCAKKNVDISPEYNPETDFNVSLNHYGCGAILAESEEGFYYTDADRFVRFIDKETMQDIALCNKPNCSHTSSDREVCSAYKGGIHPPNEMYYYKGSLYGFLEDYKPDEFGMAGVSLCEIATDGSTSKKIWNLKWKGGTANNYYFGLLHRGVFYFYAAGEQSSGKVTFSVYAYDLETKKCKCIYDNPDIYGGCLNAIGNFVYWRVFTTETIDGKATEKYTVMRYEISTGEITEFEGVTKCFAGGDKVFFEYWDDEIGCRKIHYTYRDGSNYTKTDALLEGIGHADNQYIYAYPYAVNDTTVNVYNINTFELVAELDISKQLQEHMAFYLIPGNDEVLFLTNDLYDILFYAYKSTIGTPDFQWYQVEKVN